MNAYHFSISFLNRNDYPIYPVQSVIATNQLNAFKMLINALKEKNLIEVKVIPWVGPVISDEKIF